MVKIKPFRATYYNPLKFKTPAKVSCPPYDVISPKKLTALRKQSPYNFTNIIIADNGDYSGVARRFTGWLDKKVLIDEEKESFYLYEQTFACGGKRYRRFGLLVLLKMESSIFPHEHTLTKPKEDRKRIIEAVKANLDPVFLIVPRPVKTMQDAYRRRLKAKPFFRFRDCDGNINAVWKIQDPGEIKRLSAALEKSNLVIADGHHRFAVANEYARRNAGKFRDLDYVLAYITDAQPGLVILPTHRVVSLNETLASTLAKLNPYFTITRIAEKNLGKRLGTEKNAFAFAIYNNKKLYLLQLKNRRFIDKIDADAAYKKLDTFLLHRFVLPMLGAEGEIQYTHSAGEAKKMAGNKKFAFILNAVPLETIFEIANKGFRFPQKTTYFQPKVLSGIILRRFKA